MKVVLDNGEWGGGDMELFIKNHPIFLFIGSARFMARASAYLIFYIYTLFLSEGASIYCKIVRFIEFEV